MTPGPRGRDVGLGLVALMLIAVMTGLGLWQLSVFDDRQQRQGAEQLAREPVPLADVLGPDDAFPTDAVGRPVQVSGAYVGDEQVYVEQLPGHDDDYAVATPLVDQTGSAILVVRGSADSPDESDPAVAPPTGPVVVEGILEPTTSAGTAPDDRRVAIGVRIPALAGAFSADVYSGYVVLRNSRPPESLPPVEAPTPEPSLLTGLRNLAYALQWWVFAGFVAFMWWRVVHDREADVRDDLAVTEPPKSGRIASGS